MSLLPETIVRYFKGCKKLDMADRVALYNATTELLKDMLEMDDPVLAVKLVEVENIQGNDYNPNKVAPPEMRLLELSMAKDGITMPVVAAQNDKGHYVVVDGFHRLKVMRKRARKDESEQIYVPVVELNKSIAERIAATVRHNMARGSHQTELSARLVALLKKHNWTDEKVSRELGMDNDEVLRLKQMSGLAEAFRDKAFSQSWE